MKNIKLILRKIAKAWKQKLLSFEIENNTNDDVPGSQCFFIKVKSFETSKTKKISRYVHHFHVIFEDQLLI
mgnify:CR=1 FL=1